jgi:hypothetical protein
LTSSKDFIREEQLTTAREDSGIWSAYLKRKRLLQSALPEQDGKNIWTERISVID